ncbi:MAG: hypothetical protein COU51_03505 [Parcubacteria group bacterium CG10_big_fil_rev_8_21_14_0_10_36_14]|nr:MAG: hypothetical protein COU51_03505 [Parcubacteria group bacterium CG10_big_fil_rev_8_21_14_0_10_36_14]
MSFFKKIFVLFTLLLLIGVYALPIFVFAQTTGNTAKEPPMQCWPQDLCKQKSGIWTETASSKKECTTFDGKTTAYCYAPPPTVSLQVSIGGTQVKGLLDYIPRIYTYLVSIVSIVAVIMIMIGGLQYLTSVGNPRAISSAKGGNPGAINSAKERILGAIVGLFLTLGSYFLLNTINPALTQLKLPEIKMVRRSVLTVLNSKNGDCPADSPQKTGKVALTNCSNDCDCFTGDTCEEVGGEAGQIIAASKVVVWSATAVTGGAVAGASNVASAGQYIIRGALNVLKPIAKTLGKFVIANPVDTATGVGAYMVVSSLGDSGPATKSVSNGICVKLAKKSIPAFGLCAFNSNCISGKCIDLTTGKELSEEKLGNIGSCAGDPVSIGTSCRSNIDCTNAGTVPGEWECIGVLKDKTTGEVTKNGLCSNGSEGALCCITGVGPDNDIAKLECSSGEKQCKTNYICAFSYDSKWFATGANYSAVPCSTNENFCKAYYATLIKSDSVCLGKDTAIQQP